MTPTTFNDKDRERAVEVAAELSHHQNEPSCTGCVDIIAAALAAVREEERERACKIVCYLCAANFPLVPDFDGDMVHQATHGQGPYECRAAAIRQPGLTAGE